MRCREPLLSQGMADELVKGVVAADVLVESQDAALVIEETCGMEAAGGVEDILAFPEEGREMVQEGGGDREPGICGIGDVSLKAIQGGLPAYAAAGACVGVALGAGEVGGVAFGQGDRYGVGRGQDADVLYSCLDDAFRVQPAEGELFVVARGAHGDREAMFLSTACGAVLDADLQRVFDRDRVGSRPERVSRYFLHWQPGYTGGRNYNLRRVGHIQIYIKLGG